MPKIVPKCSCGGSLTITGEIRENNWRVGFHLICKNCSKKWKYYKGSYYKE
ncbi:MAG: hypothetical protein QXX95_05150 [Nitrososphaerales archaeon]